MRYARATLEFASTPAGAVLTAVGALQWGCVATAVAFYLASRP